MKTLTIGDGCEAVVALEPLSWCPTVPVGIAFAFTVTNDKGDTMARVTKVMNRGQCCDLIAELQAAIDALDAQQSPVTFVGKRHSP